MRVRHRPTSVSPVQDTPQSLQIEPVKLIRAHRPTSQPKPETPVAQMADSHSISLRVKLLIAFSMVFSVVFAGAFYWFYTFTTDKTISRLRTDLRSTLSGAVAGLDVEELLALYQNGAPNAAGFSDDPRYLNQLEWFETVQSIEPRAWLYSYVVDQPSHNRRVGVPATQPGELETIYLVDLWVNYDPSKAVRFLEPDQTSSRSRQVLEFGELVEEPRIYQDDWGTWLSAFAPLKNDEGDVVAILGLDIEADYIFQLQRTIRNRVFLSFIITYGVLFALIYVLSGILTRQLSELTHSAKQIAAGNYDLDVSLTQRDANHQLRSNRHIVGYMSDTISSRFTNVPDELNMLSQVFDGMVDSIRTRERLIREGKQVEDEIRQALQVERELNELKSRFVSMVSHEFRTPLTVLRTSIELLEHYDHMTTEEKRGEYFQRIRVAIATMTQLLEDVLVVGKAEAGKLDFKPIFIDLQEFCREIVGEIQMSTSTQRDIRFNSSGDCSAICADKNLLRPILTNLLSNAVKYSSPEKPVDLTLRCFGSDIIIEVCDRGIGIPLDDQSHLFELFHRAKNAEDIRGTGLGLAIVKQCVTHHQGQITFASQIGQGTTFIVKLPRYPQYDLDSDLPPEAR
ncbi:MAG: HAMP domain-containing sensor histidine kinase [Elainellaceae cyanobacterium]